MADDLLLAVASALAGSTVEAAVAGGKSALAALVRLVRRRLDRERTGRAILDAAREDPADQARIARLAAVLARTMADDPVFAEQVRSRWRQVRAGAAVEGDVINHFGGVAEKVVQARDVHGGIDM